MNQKPCYFCFPIAQKKTVKIYFKNEFHLQQYIANHVLSGSDSLLSAVIQFTYLKVKEIQRIKNYILLLFKLD